jgi:phospholipase/lecithinase/hemolysin
MAAALSNAIATMASLGAEHFLWLNLPQLATTPRGAADIQAAPGLAAAFTAASTQFQVDVAADTQKLNLLPAVQVTDVDIYGLYQKILANPAKYGYTNTTGFAQGNPAANPDQYLFWDPESHPTTTGQILIADAAFAAIVPEPATWAFAGAGLLMVFWRRRRK